MLEYYSELLFVSKFTLDYYIKIIVASAFPNPSLDPPVF